MNGRLARLLTGLMLAGFLAHPGPVMAADPLFDAMGVVPPKTALPAPDFTLPRLSGGDVSLSDLAGKVVLLNFWATWCAPCLKEMPAIDALYDRYADQGLEVLAVNVDRGSEKRVRRWVAKHGVRMPVARDARGKVRRDYEVIALPVTYLIDRDGRFLARIIGEREWDSGAAQALIEKLLQAAP